MLPNYYNRFLRLLTLKQLTITYPSPNYLPYYTTFSNSLEIDYETLPLMLFDPQLRAYIYTDASQKRETSMVCQPELYQGKTYLYPITFFSIRFTPTQ